MMFFIHQKGKYTLHKRLHYFSAFTGKALAALIAVLCIASLCHGQDAGTAPDSGEEEIRPLKVGEKVPEEFWTREHLFYIDGDTVRKNLEEYKGKLLVLDFWATWCAICLHQMGGKQSLFSHFPDKANLLLVNPLVTKDTYTSIASHQDRLSEFSTTPVFTSIIEDERIQQLFPNHIYPRYAWIGPRGDLIGLTTARFATEGNLKEMLGILDKDHEKE
ncbi:MAG TPA: hypothetical protein VK102_11610 [Sphingobacterium sp.]|nr:hypothetical protein [Sphingobacterium sp.]